MEPSDYQFKKFDEELKAEQMRMAACRLFLETMGVVALLAVVAMAGSWLFSA